jgi:CheY-like chemotaxis protein
MKSILVLSENKDVMQTIRSCLSEKYEVVYVSDNERGLAAINERPYDLLLADLDLLRGSNSQSAIKHVLQPYWNLRPTIEFPRKRHHAEPAMFVNGPYAPIGSGLSNTIDAGIQKIPVIAQHNSISL